MNSDISDNYYNEENNVKLDCKNRNDENSESKWKTSSRIKDSWTNEYPYPIEIFKDGDDDCTSDCSLDSWSTQPKGVRWPPLGAPNEDVDAESSSSVNDMKWYGQKQLPSDIDIDRLKELEVEQEQVNDSLLALTSHFAQVQFRLKQIVDASPTEKEKLLVELEEFANRGIPDFRCDRRPPDLEGKLDDPEKRLDLGHVRQKELICQLKKQLKDLESYAYETGEAGLPQSVLLEKQAVIIDQLKSKLNLKVDDLDNVPVEDLKRQVDYALKELINPLRMKEQLVDQLQTQIVDLERFIEFLQDSSPGEFPPLEKLGSTCKCNGHVQPGKNSTSHGKYFGLPKRTNSFRKKWEQQQQAKSLVQNLTSVLSMISFSSVNGSSSAVAGNRFRTNVLKKTPSGYHWGDLRAALEISIANLCEVVDSSILDNSSPDVSPDYSLAISDENVTMYIRKKFCPALRNLIQHGLVQSSQNMSLVPFLGCLSIGSSDVDSSSSGLHAWELLMSYYNLKKGDQYNQTPARQLSQSYNLDISSSGSGATNKQLLLQTVGEIIASHRPLKRSYDAQFKAFVCAALNKKKLITWFRLIFRTQSLIEANYQSWSYVAKTGFEDGFKSLECLKKYNFNLYVDLAVKPFQNIKDIFN